MITKSQLGIELGKLQRFINPKVRHEQYSTDPEIAAEALWGAFMLGDIKGLNIADLGAGTGILGIGALLLGVGTVCFVESEINAIEILGKNLTFLDKSHNFKQKVRVQKEDIRSFFTDGFDVVIQNPPFGTKVRGIDLIFLEKALELAPLVYSFHKTSTLDYIKSKLESQGAEITHIWHFSYPLKSTMQHHKKRIERIRVSLIRIFKPKN